MSQTSASLFNILGPTTVMADQDARVRWSVATSASATAGILLRAQNSANYYLARYAGANTIQFLKKVGGSTTAVTAFSFTVTAGTFYWMRFQVQGSIVAIKVWQDGSLEPTSWGFTTTDTALSAPGGVGLYGYTSTSTPNTFDSFTVTALTASSTTSTATPTSPPTDTPTSPPTATPTSPPTATLIPPTDTPTPTTTPPTPTTTPVPGGLSGTITDAATGVGLQNVQVTTDVGGYSATTDNTGTYTIANVAPGTYNVTASAAGYNSSFQGNVVVISARTAGASLALSSVPLDTSMDTYKRYDQTGWGTASDGNVWNADFTVYPLGTESITTTQGYVDAYTGQTDLDNWMGATYPDQEVSADFLYTAVGQDSYLHGPRLLGRVTDEHHYIDFAINVTNNTLALWVNNGENWSQIAGPLKGPGFLANTLYHAKLDTIGTTVRAKVWVASAAEPGWQVQAIQSVLNTRGTGGVRTTYAYVYWQNFKTTSLTSMAGTVTDSSGQPIAGATVSTGNGITTTTNRQGQYNLAVTGGTYTVTASAPGYTATTQSISITTGSTQAANFTLT